MFTQHFTPACTSLCRMHTRVYVCVRFLMPQANTPHICTRVRAEHYNTLMVLYRLNGFTRVRVFGFDTEWTWFFFCVSACAFCVCVLMRTRAKGGLNRRVSIKHVCPLLFKSKQSRRPDCWWNYQQPCVGWKHRTERDCREHIHKTIFSCLPEVASEPPTGWLIRFRRKMYVC